MNGPTPGEWIVSPRNPELVIWKHTGQVIADFDQDPAREQRVANARLCAAAPGLDETLKGTPVRHLSYFRGAVADGQITRPAILAARAAISKAEGKS